MKHARKLASLLLALVMVFALATTAFAAETGTTGNGTITVANPVEGRTYTAYKVFDVTYDESGHYSYTLPAFPTDDFSWYSAVRRYSQIPNSGLIEHVVGTDDTESGAESVFFTTDNKFSPANFAAYLKERLGVDRPTGHVLTEQADGTVSVSDLPLGYYFVASTSGALCNLTTTNPTVTIHDKNDMPFEKVVDKTNVDVGQTVTYTITGKVPDYTGFDTYIYEIEDTMSDGLTYLRETLKIKVGGKLVSGGPEWVTIWTTAVNGRTDAPNHLKVALNVKKFKVGDPIEVTYQAIVNEKAIAVLSNNEAKLTYSNDPTDSTKKTTTPPEIVKVYTSKIVIDKYETGSENTKLPNAEFVLYKKETSGNIISTKYYKWDGTAKKVEWVEDRAAATVVVTDDNGAGTFGGLADGTYYLVETKAPAGYNRLEEPAEIKVEGSTTDTAKLSNIAKVPNSTGTVLPSTGGMGTTVFYVLGFALVMGAVVLLVTKKRMSDANG
mgnify:CR=1 FL=1